MTTTLQELDEVLAKMEAANAAKGSGNIQPAMDYYQATSDFIETHAPKIRAALELQAKVEAGVLQAFEAKFWEAVQLSGSRDFDHDVCKEVRDFRAMLNAAPPAGKENDDAP